MSIPKILLATLALSSSLAFAQGIVLNDQNLRTDLNWLNQQGVIQISTSTWPMSGDEIQRAIAQAKINNSTQQKVIESVLAHLNANNQLLKASLFAETDQKYLPQAFGDQQKAQYQASVELNAGQMVEDVRLSVEHKVPVEHFGRTGGIIHTPEEIVAALEQKIINNGSIRHHKTRESSIL